MGVVSGVGLEHPPHFERKILKFKIQHGTKIKTRTATYLQLCQDSK
jgi:hypothetical protein